MDLETFLQSIEGLNALSIEEREIILDRLVGGVTRHFDQFYKTGEGGGLEELEGGDDSEDDIPDARSQVESIQRMLDEAGDKLPAETKGKLVRTLENAKRFMGMRRVMLAKLAADLPSSEPLFGGDRLVRGVSEVWKSFCEDVLLKSKQSLSESLEQLLTKRIRLRFSDYTAKSFDGAGDGDSTVFTDFIESPLDTNAVVTADSAGSTLLEAIRVVAETRMLYDTQGQGSREATKCRGIASDVLGKLDSPVECFLKVNGKKYPYWSLRSEVKDLPLPLHELKLLFARIIYWYMLTVKKHLSQVDIMTATSEKCEKDGRIDDSTRFREKAQELRSKIFG